VKTPIIGQNPEATASAGTQAQAPAAPEASVAQEDASPGGAPPAPEVGGRGGLDPVRYGDWEKNGRCIDF
jgi:hypothetical protein